MASGEAWITRSTLTRRGCTGFVVTAGTVPSMRWIPWKRWIGSRPSSSVAVSPRTACRLRRAADAVREIEPIELLRLAANGRLTTVPGIGDTTAQVVMEALADQEPAYLRRLEGDGVPKLDPAAAAVRAGAARRPPLPHRLVRRWRDARADGRSGDRGGPRVPRRDRPLPRAQDRQRAVARTTRGATRRDRALQRSTGAVPIAHGHRGRHPAGRLLDDRTSGCSPSSTSSSPACTPSYAWSTTR